ncbi:transposase [Methylobacterium brachythecii]|uniref:Transposase n=1 Tax=Methylobacterium brachythecii TaxID=1176177 RepID=A0A7W6AHV1_9HYPH|nr:transposase [Methylobacterium brachythecii]MBB3903623.1 transposase [Methylobacterium brachythecii]GLS44192.1 transposase [Methylobacterium brachythecii]
MMGPRQVEQGALFYEFSLDTHVPTDHLLRSIDRFVDLTGLRQELAPFYASTGRPSVDPELMIRMLIVGYCLGIRSERRLCDEVHLNLANRWFCRLGLDGRVPDHSTFSKNRHGRFRDRDLLRRLFETVLARCIAEGLVGGEGFAVDGSLIKADANRQKGVEGSAGLPPEVVSRAAQEYLAVLDEAATPVPPKFISPADPAARWTGAHGGQAFFAYTANYLIDLDHAIIVDVEATTAIRQAEVTAAKRMIERSRERFELYPAKLAGDSGYGSAEMLGWLVYEQGIEPHISVFDKSTRTDGTFSRADFTYDQPGDVYRCPAGQVLTTTGTLVNDGATLLYRASKFACAPCPLKARCCPNEPVRKVPRSIYEGARDMARDIARSEEGKTSRRERKKVEMLFAHLKRILKLDRLRLRGPNGAKDEFHLAAAAQNLRKLAKLIPLPQPSPA